MKLFAGLKNIFKTKTSKTTVLNTTMGSAHWPEKDYYNFAKESYMKNVISFRCIFYIASSLASVKWGVYKLNGNKREEISDSPINKLLSRPNPNESFVALVQKMISYIYIAGNTYIERVSLKDGIPRELYVLRPDKMTINTNEKTGQISQYVYDQTVYFDVDPITLKSDILQIKNFHPLDDFFGLSITEPTAREIDSSNEAIEWQKKMFENECRPGMILLVNGHLTDEQWDRIYKQLDDKFKGSGNSGRTFILEGETSADAKPYSWSPKEMDWIESNREMARRICLGHGIAPMLLGIPGDNTYSNYKEARASFFEETVIYWLNLIKGEFNNWLFEDNSIFIDYDLSDNPALAYKMDLIWTRIKDCTFMTLNEKREAVGMEKIAGGDIVLIPMGMTTLDQINAEKDNPELSEVDQQNQDQEQENELVEEGFERDLAKLMVGNMY